ncbi:MAG: hypothetical protein J1E16_04200 [Muribaculaceae bacterium]|nr:hypothetical protein [Muribaculaceae bacterium]
MYTDKEQQITRKKTFDGSVDDLFSILLDFWGTTSQISNFLGSARNWNNGVTSSPNGILVAAIYSGICFDYEGEKWVIGNVRGDAFNSVGLGIGKLQDDKQIIPVLRIAQDGLFFMEKKITE